MFKNKMIETFLNSPKVLEAKQAHITKVEELLGGILEDLIDDDDGLKETILKDFMNQYNEIYNLNNIKDMI